MSRRSVRSKQPALDALITFIAIMKFSFVLCFIGLSFIKATSAEGKFCSTVLIYFRFFLKFAFYAKVCFCLSFEETIYLTHFDVPTWKCSIFSYIYKVTIIGVSECDKCVQKENCPPFRKLNQEAQDAWQVKFPCASPEDNERSKLFGFAATAKGDYVSK